MFPNESVSIKDGYTCNSVFCKKPPRINLFLSILRWEYIRVPLPGKILNLLAKTITDLGAMDDVKVIVLKSAGERAFCAGASFDELISIDN